MLVGPDAVGALGRLEVPRELPSGGGKSPRGSQRMGRWKDPDEEPAGLFLDPKERIKQQLQRRYPKQEWR